MNIEKLLNCEAMKKQFALELWLDTRGTRFNPYKSHEVTYVAAENLLRKLWPYSTGPTLIARVAVEWVNDPIVMQTFLQLENGKGEVISHISKEAFIAELWEAMQRMNPTLKPAYTGMARDILAPMLGLDWDSAVAELEGQARE